MEKTPNKNLENMLNQFINKNLNMSAENTEKVMKLINSLSEDDIKKIAGLAKSGQLQKIMTNVQNTEK